MKKLLLYLVLTSFTFQAMADEGMWLPQLLKALNEKDMRKKGLKLRASDIYSISKASLKDAIVSLGGFCTAEVISDQGLLLTNHHCGFDAIQNHSTLEKNYIRDGFWARQLNQEIPNEGLTASFIIRIEEVTEMILKDIAATASEKERQAMIEENIKKLRSSYKKEAHEDLLIRPFFEGNKYFLFVTETFKDVRLVGAPPSSIGNFGKDTDNWMWPRHTGDFTLFRIYAGKDNKPAAYSPDNVPYKPRRSLTISLKGMKEGDFTMVFGFPGRTMQYLPGSAVKQIMTVNDPARIAIREDVLKVMDGYMRKDEGIKIKYAAKYASIQNAYKKWQGEVLGLTSKNALGKKAQYEADFTGRLNADETALRKYGSVLPDLNKAYDEFEPYSRARDYYTEIMPRIEIFSIAAALNNVVTAWEKDASTFPKAKIQALEKLSGTFNEFDPQVDKSLFTVLIKKYASEQPAQFVAASVAAGGTGAGSLAEKIYSSSSFTDMKKIRELLEQGADDAVRTIRNDPAMVIYKDMVKTYSDNAQPKVTEIQSRINRLQRNYMAAQMEVFKDKKFYPDANGTLRVTYGNVKGYKPKDAVSYGYYTYLDGVMQKYKPGDYEFDVPAGLIELYNKKDYGRYGDNGRLPVCFIGANHTTGGNSGSPALDRKGNLVGLNFDRVWEGTMSDINYDPDICRNVMVDIRYILFIIDKYAGAANLVSEMKFSGK